MIKKRAKKSLPELTYMALVKAFFACIIYSLLIITDAN